MRKAIGCNLKSQGAIEQKKLEAQADVPDNLPTTTAVTTPRQYDASS